MVGLFGFLTGVLGKGEAHFTLTPEGECEHRPRWEGRRSRDEAIALSTVQCRPVRRSPPVNPHRWGPATYKEPVDPAPIISYASIRRSPSTSPTTFIFRPSKTPTSSPRSAPNNSPSSTEATRGSPVVAENNSKPSPRTPPRVRSPATGPAKSSKVTKPKAKPTRSNSVMPRRSGRKPAPKRAPEGIVLEPWKKGPKRSPKDRSYVDKPQEESPAPSPILPKPRKPVADPTFKPSHEGSESPEIIPFSPPKSKKRAASASSGSTSEEERSLPQPAKKLKTTKAAKETAAAPSPAPKSILKQRGRKPKSATSTTRKGVNSFE